MESFGKGGCDCDCDCAAGTSPFDLLASDSGLGAGSGPVIGDDMLYEAAEMRLRLRPFNATCGLENRNAVFARTRTTAFHIHGR